MATETRKPTAAIAPFGLRMQPELRARVEAAAEGAGRSLNAEIVARLEKSFETAGVTAVTDDAFETMIRQAVATSLYHVTRSMAAIVEGGKHAEKIGKNVDYVGMVRQMADEFRDNYEHEIGFVVEAKQVKPKGRALDLRPRDEDSESSKR